MYKIIFLTAIVEKMSVKTKEQADELIAEKIKKKQQMSDKIVSKYCFLFNSLVFY